MEQSKLLKSQGAKFYPNNQQSRWMSDFLTFLMGWILGIPSGIVANWLYDKLKKSRRKKEDFLDISYSKGRMRFEGQQNIDVPIKTLIDQVLRPPSEPTKQDNQTEPPTQQAAEGLPTQG